MLKAGLAKDAPVPSVPFACWLIQTAAEAVLSAPDCDADVSFALRCVFADASLCGLLDRDFAVARSDLAENITSGATGTRRRAARAAANVARSLAKSPGSTAAAAALPSLESLADALGAALSRAMAAEAPATVKSRGLQARCCVVRV
jgi:hypothetical protein